ncbi:MAG TPA: WYL domain-containing protein [Myxococcota bacterium]|nr:WYL domain-containing protein [Myxococcota bacterium]
MSHDADKLIRQLSLVAYLMAERRPITARDVKSNVEGYSEMSDEAFARRFYSDRAELQGLGVPLQSQRDEFTGEELYNLRSENYFLPELSLSDDEFAALQTSVYLLEGQFAYAEPLRLALQNLAAGRAGFEDALSPAAGRRVRMSDPDYSPEMAGRLAKLETAYSKGRTVKFEYWSISRDEQRERTVNPLALLNDGGAWYIVGEDLDDERRRKKFRVSRIRGDIRFATRRERDFRIPADFSIDDYRGKPAWQLGDAHRGEARVAVRGDTAWWIVRTLPNAGTVTDGVFETPYASVAPLASWVLRQNGRATPLDPDELRADVAAALERIAAGHEGPPALPADESSVLHPDGGPERPTGPVAPERFGVLQALLAHLLGACGDDRSAELDARDVAKRFKIPLDELEEHLSLLNLVNFGGGCYTVYAERRGDVVHVDKELYSEVFRKPPRLTPLEARAVRLALEFVGPMIAADSRSSLERVRAKLEETFGAFELAQTPRPQVGSDEEELVQILSEGVERRRVVEFEYLKEGEREPTRRLVEPYSFERELPVWRVHTWDRTVGEPRTYRLDRMRAPARLTDEKFEPRPDFDPNYLRDPRVARVLYSPAIARYKIERGASPRADGTALAELPFQTEDWLAGEILADRGEAVVLEPADVRARLAERARTLAAELGVTRRAAARR